MGFLLWKTWSRKLNIEKIAINGSVDKQLLHEGHMYCVYHPVISMARWGRDSRSS